MEKIAARKNDFSAKEKIALHVNFLKMQYRNDRVGFLLDGLLFFSILITAFAYLAIKILF